MKPTHVPVYVHSASGGYVIVRHAGMLPTLVNLTLNPARKQNGLSSAEPGGSLQMQAIIPLDEALAQVDLRDKR